MATIKLLTTKVISFRHVMGPVKCKCDLQWLLQWLQANKEHKIIGECQQPSGSVRLNELRIEDLDCQGSHNHMTSHVLV